MELAIVSGRANKVLAEKTVAELDDKAEWIDTEITDFANGELHVKYEKSLRGKDVYIIQSSNSDPNKDMMELLLMIHTAYRASARRITAIIPYIYGSRQDRKTEPRTPVTISLIADMLEAARADRVITFSLHSPQSTASFKKVRIDNISPSKIFSGIIKKAIKNSKEEWVIVSPDTGGIGRARYYSNLFHIPIAFANKYRPARNKSKITEIVGDVKDKNCILIDDMIDTGNSLIELVNTLKENDAKKIIAIVTHLILSKDAKEILEKSEIEIIYGTDSIQHGSLPGKFEIHSIASMLADVILRIHEDRSVGVLFEKFIKWAT